MDEQKNQCHELIPAMKEWSNFEGFETPPHWLNATGNFEQAIAYSFIFWPEFIAIDGYVLRADAYEPDNLRTWADRNDRPAVEAVINHVHISDLFPTCEGSEVQLRFLGCRLKQMLKAKLAQDFPYRSFEVSFNDEPGLDLIDYQVTFWQVDAQPKMGRTE